VIRQLVFSRAETIAGARSVRGAGFANRSNLPASAACLVANAVRETLVPLLRAELGVRVFEPCVPSAEAWRAIAQSAFIYRVPGSRTDAALFLRAVDALALASALFGEPSGGERELSPIERTVLERTVTAIAGTLAPVCGTVTGRPVREEASVARYASYFELQLERSLPARIGVALSNDPAPELTEKIQPHGLDGVELTASARIPLASITAGDLARLECGEILPMTVERALQGWLEVAGVVVAQGQCGVIGRRYAFAVRTEEGRSRAA
jgi:flagellar motor switch protein FliM